MTAADLPNLRLDELALEPAEASDTPAPAAGRARFINVGKS